MNDLNLNQVMIGTMQPKSMAHFYEQVFGRASDWHDGDWYGWQTGSCSLVLGHHSEMDGAAKEPGRVMFNLETEDVQGEFKRLKKEGAIVIKEPYEMGEMDIATFADPDGNYFQLISPWESP